MNNEIEQIAQQNDMSVEFVRWFFNEKKADCGEQWFLALGAMWEGWKAREGEVTALALTLEKSREASGCQAGVELQDWVKQLAAENVALKATSDDRRMFIMNGVQLGYIKVPTVETDPALETIRIAVSPQEPTPATDRIVAGIKADGVALAKSAFEKHIQSPSCYQDEMVGMESALSIACQVELQLREGADK